MALSRRTEPLLQTIPANEAVQELLDECTLKQAEAVLETGNAEEAEKLLKKVREAVGLR